MTPSELDIVGIGAVNLDMVFSEEATRRTGRFQAVAPDRELALASEEELDEAASIARRHDSSPHARVGGSTFNTLHTLGRMQRDLALGFVGIDGEFRPGGELLDHGEEGRPAAALLEQAGVRFDLMRRSTSRAGVCLAGQDVDGRRLLTWPGANREMATRLQQPEERQRTAQYVARSRIVHVTSFLDDETPPLLAAVLSDAKAISADLKVTLDPGFVWASQPPQGFDELLRLSDFLLLNEREFWHLDNRHGTTSDERAAASKILNRCGTNASVLVLKIRDGATVFCQRDGRLRSAEIRRPVTEPALDDTGAGDAFAAGFLAGLVHTDLVAVKESAQLGSRVAAERVLHRSPDWYGPVARTADEFVSQLEAKSRPHPGEAHYVLRSGSARETLDYLAAIGEGFLDAAHHLRFALNVDSEPWTERQLQHLTKAFLAPVLGEALSEEWVPGGGARRGRLDLLFPSHNVGVELKLASRQRRDGILAQELWNQTATYKRHGVRGMFCLIFDPDQCLTSPQELVADLPAELDEMLIRGLVVGRTSL